MLYKAVNKSKHDSSKFCYGSINKSSVKFISKAFNHISSFFKSLFSNTPYIYEDYLPAVRYNDSFKSRTDLYLTENRRTFL